MRLELYRKYDVSSFTQELRPPSCTSQLSFRRCLYIQNRFRQLVTLFPWGSPVLCQLPSDAHGATVCSSSPPWSSCDPSQPKGMLLYISWGDNLRSIRENKAPHADAISMSLLLTTVTHRRSFHMKSNYPFPHSVKQHCMLGVRLLLALVWAYCVEHACFSLGTGCPQQPVWCSSAFCQGLTLRRRDHCPCWATAHVSWDLGFGPCLFLFQQANTLPSFQLAMCGVSACPQRGSATI